MKKIRILSGNPVTLARVSSSLPIIMRPGIGDYRNEFIKSLVPAEKIGNKYFHLLTGEEIMTDGNTLVWANLSGTVYKVDGRFYLLSRRFSDSKIMLLEIQPEELNGMMIVRDMYGNRFREQVFHHINEYQATERKLWEFD